MFNYEKAPKLRLFDELISFFMDNLASLGDFLSAYFALVQSLITGAQSI